jgi:large subunit ribosomal protein L6
MTVVLRGGEIVVERPDDSVQNRALHGLTRSLIANMVTGVTKGFAKTLELAGVGYRVSGNSRRLALQLGFSHPIEITPPSGIEIGQIQSFTPTQGNEWLSGRFTINGIDKELVGEVAANIRKIREVEPYKGKGLRYQGERVRRKAGKAAGKGKK